MYCVTQGVDRNGPSVYISIYDVVEYCLSEMLHQIYLERVMFPNIGESVSNIHQPINE